MATVTRRDLTEAVCDEMGLVHRDAAELSWMGSSRRLQSGCRTGRR